MQRHLFISSLVAAITVIYPIVIYFGIEQFGVSAMAFILFVLLVLRIVIIGKIKQPGQWSIPLLVGGLCLVAAWLDSEALLRYYPVLMNGIFASFFLISLTDKQSLIERIARNFKKKISPHAKAYMRGLTMVWAGILLLNSFISFYTACCLSISQWAFYNAVLVYIFFAVFTLIELTYRQYYKRKFET